jgi:hypothetical protein
LRGSIFFFKGGWCFSEKRGLCFCFQPETTFPKRKKKEDPTDSLSFAAFLMGKFRKKNKKKKKKKKKKLRSTTRFLVIKRKKKKKEWTASAISSKKET